jgi:hypothetical protein
MILGPMEENTSSAPTLNFSVIAYCPAAPIPNMARAFESSYPWDQFVDPKFPATPNFISWALEVEMHDNVIQAIRNTDTLFIAIRILLFKNWYSMHDSKKRGRG